MKEWSEKRNLCGCRFVLGVCGPWLWVMVSGLGIGYFMMIYHTDSEMWCHVAPCVKLSGQN